MAHRKRRNSRRRSLSPSRIVRGVAALAGAAILLEKPLEKGLPPLMAGNIPAAFNGAIDGIKESAHPSRVMAALTPSITAEVGLGAVRLVRSFTRTRA